MGKSGNPAVRAEQDVPTEYDPTPVDADGVEDFDAFWETQDRKRPTVRIMGELVHLPPAMPLQAELLMNKLERRSDERSVRKVVAVLYGPDQMDRWAGAGMDGEQFNVLLAWTVQKLNGGSLSMAEVRARLAEAEAGGGQGEA